MDTGNTCTTKTVLSSLSLLSPDCGLSPLSWLRDGLRSRDAMCVEALAERDMCTSRKRALTK